jgi:RNA recognition motif-containing protein
MSFTVFLGNLPAWVTADDIRGWLSAESLVADAIKVIRNPETQESKGFAFIEAPNIEEMNSIIRRFDRAPLEDRLLRANPAQPPKPKSSTRPAGGPGYGGGPPGGSPGGYGGRPHHSDSRGHGQSSRDGYVAHTPATHAPATQAPAAHVPAGNSPAAHDQGQGQASGPNQASTPPIEQRPPRRGKRAGAKKPGGGSSSAFAEELAKAL